MSRTSPTACRYIQHGEPERTRSHSSDAVRQSLHERRRSDGKITSADVHQHQHQGEIGFLMRALRTRR